jgi:hypothetical protein
VTWPLLFLSITIDLAHLSAFALFSFWHSSCARCASVSPSISRYRPSPVDLHYSSLSVATRAYNSDWPAWWRLAHGHASPSLLARIHWCHSLTKGSQGSQVSMYLSSRSTTSINSSPALVFFSLVCVQPSQDASPLLLSPLPLFLSACPTKGYNKLGCRAAVRFPWSLSR